VIPLNLHPFRAIKKRKKKEEKRETYTLLNLARWEGVEQVMWFLTRKPCTDNAE